MPYVVRKDDRCPASKPWGVSNQQTGDLHGCHPTKEHAASQQRALYAAQDDARPRSAMGGVTGEAARSYLESMVPHHQHAVEMSRAYLAQHVATRDPAVDTMARGIISGQQAEIARMRGWLGQQPSRSAAPPEDVTAVPEHWATAEREG